MADICIYHANCADGFTAAWAVRKMLGDTVQFVPGVYGEAPPDVTGKDVLLVDFSYKRPVLEAMAETARSILVLDHHKTAQADLEPFAAIPLGSSVQEETERARSGDNSARKINALFDMERSGAMIAWQHFHDEEAPNLVQFVQDRDLWRFDIQGSREVAAFIFSHEYTFENWDRLHAILSTREGIQSAIDSGSAIERKHFKDIAELLAMSARSMLIGGHLVQVANLPYTMSSDAAGKLGEGAPFGASYMDTPKGRVFSLRSRGESAVDVSEVAKGYGGGGHKNAAGFTMPIGWEGDVP